MSLSSSSVSPSPRPPHKSSNWMYPSNIHQAPSAPTDKVYPNNNNQQLKHLKPKKKKNERTEAIKKPFRSFPEWTSTHGIPQIGRSKAIYCIGFWSVITVVALGVLIWQTTLLIMQYYEYPVSVQIEVGAQPFLPIRRERFPRKN